MEAFQLTVEERQELLNLAHRSLRTDWNLTSTGQKKPIFPKLYHVIDVFISLYSQGVLRGCMGRIHNTQPL